MVKVMIIRREEREREEEGRDDNENNFREGLVVVVVVVRVHPFLQDRHDHGACHQKKKYFIQLIKTNLGKDNIFNSNKNSSTVNLNDLCG